MDSGRESSGSSGRIVVCGEFFSVDWDRVVNFRDEAGSKFSVYPNSQAAGPDSLVVAGPRDAIPAGSGEGRPSSRFCPRIKLSGQRNLDRLQQVIRQFVVHHDGVESSDECRRVLLKRGLSVHFLIDNDGTIYQTLDLADCAFHAAGVNGASIGVELCNRGHVDDKAKYYKSRGQERERAPAVKVHDELHEMWSFTPRQYGAMVALAKAFSRLFPNLPLRCPQDSKGQLIRTALQSPEDYAGYMGHYHVTQQKWDPGCFDFRYVLDQVRSRPSWFFCPSGKSDPYLPDDDNVAQTQSTLVLRSNQDDAMGGFFPVGPCGSGQVWHGGLHFGFGNREAPPLFAPLAGRLVAARLGADTPIGSCNFVLTRHFLTLDGHDVRFYVLLFHLAMDAHDVEWVKVLRAEHPVEYAQLRRGEPVFPDIDVSGGERIGSVGSAGPPNGWEPQVHIEVMAAKEITAAVEPGAFQQVQAKQPSLLCSERELLGPLGAWRQRQGGGSPLRDFFAQESTSQQFRRMAVRFRSEWGKSSEYESELLGNADFRGLPRFRTIFQEQIRPTLWLTKEIAQRVGLPDDFVVWHYHPVEFLLWLRRHLQRQNTVAAAERTSRPGDATDGYHGGGDDSYLSEEDRILKQENDSLELQDLAAGWPD